MKPLQGKPMKDRVSMATEWLGRIERYLESGDGDWEITQEDRAMLDCIRAVLLSWCLVEG